MMRREISWEDSSHLLKQAVSNKMPIAPSLLISRIPIWWQESEIGEYQIIPLLDRMERNIMIHGVWLRPPCSRFFVLRKKESGKERIDPFYRLDVGLAMSTIITFVYRCLVISYEASFPLPLMIEKNIKVLEGGEHWIECWRHFFGLSIIERSKYLGLPITMIRLPEFKRNLEITKQLYATLMSADYEIYESIMRALRLYQLSFFAASVDLSLAYSLLVAAVDSISSSVEPKVKLSDIDPEGRLDRLMEELQLNEQTQKAVKDAITYGTGLTKRFSNFIADNLPDGFWEGDYSMAHEIDLDIEYHSSGRWMQDLGESMSGSMRNELLKIAEEDKKLHGRIKWKSSKRWIFSEENREWMLNYLQVHLKRVLSDTFGSRSEHFHFGKEFPKKAFNEDEDWVPDIFEEDRLDFAIEHFGHLWSYKPKPNGRIERSCSCGDRKQIKVILGIRVFERMVHDVILNYLKTELLAKNKRSRD